MNYQNMIQVKNKIAKAGILALLVLIIVSFNYKPLAFDAGTIVDPSITVIGTTTSFTITATSASGCAGTVSYQWQQSSDTTNFIDIHNANSVSYLGESLLSTTYFRRKAICSGEVAYTSNIAIVTVMPQEP